MAIAFTKDADQRLKWEVFNGGVDITVAGVTMCGFVRPVFTAGSTWAGRAFGLQDFDVTRIDWWFASDAVYIGDGANPFPQVTSGDWYFCAIVVSTTGAVTAYLKNISASGSMATTAETTTAVRSEGFCVGGSNAFGADSFGGDAQWFRVFNATLSATEIEAESNSSTPIHASLWARWDLIDPATAVDDTSGNTRHLTASSVAVTDATDLSLGTATVTASIAATLDVPTSTIAATVSPPTVTASIAATLDVPASAIAGTVSAPGVTASIAATLEVPTSAIAATVSLPVVTASIAATLEAPTSAITGTVSAPGVTASIAATLEVPTSSIAATVSLPVVTASIAATLEAPTSSITANVTSNYVTASIAATLEAPTSSITAYVDVLAAINATLEVPTSSISATFTPDLDAVPRLLVRWDFEEADPCALIRASGPFADGLALKPFNAPPRARGRKGAHAREFNLEGPFPWKQRLESEIASDAFEAYLLGEWTITLGFYWQPTTERDGDREIGVYAHRIIDYQGTEAYGATPDAAHNVLLYVQVIDWVEYNLESTNGRLLHGRMSIGWETTSSGGTNVFFRPVHIFTANKWWDVTLCKRAAGSGTYVIDVYVNGIFSETSPALANAYGAAPNTARKFFLAGRPQTRTTPLQNRFPFRGRLFRPEIWSRVRSAAEIRTHFEDRCVARAETARALVSGTHARGGARDTRAISLVSHTRVEAKHDP